MSLRSNHKFLTIFTFLTLISLFISGSYAGTKATLTAGGCITEYYLMKALTQKFNTPELTVKLAKTGNMKGMKMFAEDKFDFAYLSMPHKMLAKEMNISPDKTDHMMSIEVAYEPILVVVDKQANVSELTKEQVAAIFNGEILNWKDLGGADMAITPGNLNKLAKSGLWAAFKKLTIGMNNEFNGKHKEIKNPTAIKNFIEHTTGAITYMGYSLYDESIATAISINGVEPTMENFNSGKYPLVAKYYLTFKTDTPNKATVQTFIDFIKSDEGRKVINQQNMIASK